MAVIPISRRGRSDMAVVPPCRSVRSRMALVPLSRSVRSRMTMARLRLVLMNRRSLDMRWCRGARWRRESRIRHWGNPLADEFFDSAHHIAVFACDKRYRITCCPGSCGPADPMEVILGIPRYVIINDMRNAVDINAAGGDVRRHEHAVFPLSEPLKSLHPLRLRPIGVNCRGGDSASLEA